MKSFQALAAAVLFQALGSATAANLVLNGSFEAPFVPAGALNLTTPTAWQGSGNYQHLLRGYYGPARDGEQYAALGNSSSLSQAVTINTLGTYTLSWLDCTEFNGPGQLSPYSVSIIDSSGNTVATASFDANAGGFALWAARSLQFTVTAPGTYTLRFDGHTNVFAEESLIDNVVLPGNANSPPVAQDQSLRTDEEAPPLNIRLAATDADNDVLTFSVVSNPAHGTLTGTAPFLAYTAAPCFTGQDSFSFKANDGQADSSVATVTIEVLECEDSGPALMARFPGSTDPNDLVEPFRGNVHRFLEALASATDERGQPNPADVEITETLRTPGRAYLMYCAYLIARAGLDPAAAPQPTEVIPVVTDPNCVNWLHLDSSCNADPASFAAANEMLQTAAPHGIAHPPAYPSNHQHGRAIDMSITWHGTLVVRNQQGQPIVIRTGARNGASNPQLWAVGQTYGVIKAELVGLNDRPHWSLDGH